MANHKSAAYRARRNERKSVINHSRISDVRSSVKKVEAALGAGDKKAAEAAFLAAQKKLQSSVNKGIMHRNAAARKISRLSKRIKSVVTA